MTLHSLNDAEKKTLLKLARESIHAAVNHQPMPEVAPEEMTDTLRQPGASFVTLTIGGELRGCIGALEAYQPLAEDVREHAVAAALEDYRFPSVTSREVALLEIEISHLTSPQPLEYEKPADLPGLLKPGEDGVILRDGFRRATFLPQVWEKIPDPVDFLSQLCLKMGASWDLWARKKLNVAIYHVEEFHELK